VLIQGFMPIIWLCVEGIECVQDRQLFGLHTVCAGKLCAGMQKPVNNVLLVTEFFFVIKILHGGSPINQHLLIQWFNYEE
jgi:hypothetical protein